MGKPTGFIEFDREAPQKRKIKERLQDFDEIEQTLPEPKAQQQAARCMNCGVPFCHQGCPLGNLIPEFNDAVFEQNWEYAYQLLIATNNFPEFTGRICPAPCESSCVLAINKPAVTIEAIERFIIEKAFEKGYVKSQSPQYRTGKKVAIIGSGPAGLAAAVQLNKAGHWGIPDFKLDKDIIDRRLELMKADGIRFQPNTNIGVDIKTHRLMEEFDAVLLCTGTTIPRNLSIEGRELKGIYFAMEYLSQQNKRVANMPLFSDHEGIPYQNGGIIARDKHVVVIGGGDTGSDCVGTANRQKAKSVTQIQYHPTPPKQSQINASWPLPPMVLQTSTSHEEGCERQWAIMTKAFVGDAQGHIKSIKIVDLAWNNESGNSYYEEVPNTEREIPCDLALIATGFLAPQKEGLLADLDIETDERNCIKTKNYQTNQEKVFAAGDNRRGQSLVVWAISEGREAARAIDTYLMGYTELEAKEVSMYNTQKNLQ
jgi:glutamate synthase (NADPH) small chain